MESERKPWRPFWHSIKFLRLDKSKGTGSIAVLICHGEVERLQTVFQLNKADAVGIEAICDFH